MATILILDDRATNRNIYARLAAAIEDGVAGGVFTTPYVGDATRGLLQMLQGIAHWYREDGPDSPTQLAARHVRLALDLVGYRGPGYADASAVG